MIFFFFFFAAARCPFFCSQFCCCFMWFIELHAHTHILTYTTIVIRMATTHCWKLLPQHMKLNSHSQSQYPPVILVERLWFSYSEWWWWHTFCSLISFFFITFLLIKSKLRYTPVILNAVLSIQYFVLRSSLSASHTKVIHIFPSWNTFSPISAFEYYGLRYYFIYCCRRQPTTNNAIQQKCIGLPFHELATQPNLYPPSKRSQPASQPTERAQFYTFGRSRTSNDSVNLIECLARAQLLLRHRSNITKSERLANWVFQQKITVG